MGGEVANIAAVANRITKDIFGWFKWEEIPIYDENFKCHKVDKHKKKSKKQYKEHTHPVDVVFRYFDPYLNEHIFLNADLKSYAKSSIKTDSVRAAIESLAKTIDCASGGDEWQKKYVLDDVDYQVRGLLFIYNHDNEYDKDFMEHIKAIDPDKLLIPENSFIHLLDPARIVYLYTIVNDMMRLVASKEFPDSDYSFLYPELLLHKRHGDNDNLPATIETLCSPYMIIKHGPPDSNSDMGGYVIYYNQSGSTDKEFKYLFDILSGLQILGTRETIKIRVAHHEPDQLIKSNYQSAINAYVSDWGLDEYKRRDLERIEFEVVTQTLPNYMPGILAWRVDND